MLLTKPFYKHKRIGLIFNQDLFVGAFDSFTCEDCNGKREFSDVCIYTSQFDVAKNKTKTVLSFIFAEVLDFDNMKFKMIDDFGFGTMENSINLLINDSNCIISKIEWHKCPEDFRYAN